METPVPNPNLTNYITVAPAAKLLGVSVNTLRNWDRSGKLQSLRHPLNGYRLYLRDDLLALLRSIPAHRAARSGKGGAA